MNVISNVLASLAECLCSAIEESDAPNTCFCGVVPGDHVLPQYAGDCASECGMAYTRLLTMSPVTGIGVPSFDPGNCGASIGFDLEVGIIRCISVGNAQGDLPSDAELLEASELQMRDALTMRKAIACCDALTSKDYILGTYIPTGPRGGLVGGSWQVSVAI